MHRIDTGDFVLRRNGVCFITSRQSILAIVPGLWLNLAIFQFIPLRMHTINCLGAGSPIVDTLAFVDEAFIKQIGVERGGMTLVDAARMAGALKLVKGDLRESPGGSAGNTVFALARLGSKPDMLGKIGDDATGAFYVRSMEKAGASSTRIKHGTGPSARCLSMITPDGERTMITCLAAASTLAPEEILASDVENCRLVYVEGYLFFNPALIQRLIEVCDAAKVDLALDLGSFTVVNAVGAALPGILKKSVKLLFANEDEAKALLGDLPEEAMAKRLGELCPIAVLKLGKRGSLICNDGKLTRVEPVLAKNALDTTGAGDFWAAGFLHAWLRGASMSQCGKCGSVLGAAVVQVVGTSLDEAAWKKISAEVAAILKN
jgi:sugar/nucleoside kinase (ribokinase family)